MATNDIKELITPKNLRALAGGRSFMRGEEYFDEGAVGPVSEKSGVISAKVHGTRTYDVRLKVIQGKNTQAELDYTCTCPVGQDGDFCKHCVALGLAWLEKTDEIEAEFSEPSASTTTKKISDDDIRSWLESQDLKVILDMLMAQLTTDGQLREELVLKITKEKAVGIDLNAYRKGLRSAFHTSGFVDYYNMGDFADGINNALDSLDRLFEEGFAAETMQLCEFAIELAEDALQDCDDSDGHFGDLAERLASLHMEACEAARPDPVKLAGRLFAFEMKGSDLNFCYGAVGDYDDILGSTGLAEYRRLAEAEWARSTKDGSNPSRTISRIMESLARADGNVDALIAIKQRKLDLAYYYLEIAQIYRTAKRSDEALEWAEKGVQAFPKNTDTRLLDFLAEEYHTRKRSEEAYQCYWTQFADRAGLQQYIKLMDYAKKVERYQTAREDALAFVRKQIDNEKSKTRIKWAPPVDHSRLVEIYLWEKNTDAAWDEASRGGCSDHFWLKLAAVREKDHPADAVPVYQRMVEPIISRMKNDAYEEATRMVKHIGELMLGLGKQAEFTAYLADVKLRHKPKRNLMKLLAGV
jgi:uncharacterized Zn finger protein